MRNTGVFCPFDFKNDFRGHSRDSKRAIIDYIFSYAGKPLQDLNKEPSRSKFQNKFCSFLT